MSKRSIAWHSRAYRFWLPKFRGSSPQSLQYLGFHRVMFRLSPFTVMTPCSVIVLLILVSTHG